MVSGGRFAIALRLAAANLINDARREANGEHPDPDRDDLNDAD